MPGRLGPKKVYILCLLTISVIVSHVCAHLFSQADLAAAAVADSTGPGARGQMMSKSSPSLGTSSALLVPSACLPPCLLLNSSAVLSGKDARALLGSESLRRTLRVRGPRARRGEAGFFVS